MNLDLLTDFFKWMTIINVSVFLVISVLIMLFKNMIGKLHSKLFGIKEEDVAKMTYGFLALFKLLISIFVIIPYLSLLLLN